MESNMAEKQAFLKQGGQTKTYKGGVKWTTT